MSTFTAGLFSNKYEREEQRPRLKPSDHDCSAAFAALAKHGELGIERADPKAIYLDLKRSLECDGQHAVTKEFRKLRDEMADAICFDKKTEMYTLGPWTRPMLFATLEILSRRLF
jgi:hypothetical protein